MNYRTAMTSRGTFTTLAVGILAALTFGLCAPAHAASVTYDQYEALHAGETRYHAQHALGSRGCRVGISEQRGVTYLRKQYVGDGGAWVTLTFARAHSGDPFRLVLKGVGADARLSGACAWGA